VFAGPRIQSAWRRLEGSLSAKFVAALFGSVTGLPLQNGHRQEVLPFRGSSVLNV